VSVPRTLLIALLLLLAGCAAPSSPPDASSASASRSLLFVQQATGGGLFSLDGENGVLQLGLVGVDLDTLWFTDRPARDAGVMTTAEFVAAWAEGRDSFAADPPNAALALRVEGGGAIAFVLELLDVSYRAENATLHYKVRELATDEPILQSHGRPHSLAEVPSTFGAASLFIDDDENWCLFAYEENCETAYCDPLKPIAFDKAKCDAENEAPVPGPYDQTGPPPAGMTCPAGQIPGLFGDWKCMIWHADTGTWEDPHPPPPCPPSGWTTIPGPDGHPLPYYCGTVF
jgi:hypothetical protein